MTHPHQSNAFQLVAHGDHFNLYHRAFGQVAHGKCRAGGERRAEELGIYLVHRAEVGDVAQQHSSFHYIVKIQPCALEDGLSVEQRLARLLLDAALGKCAGGGVDGKLS